MYTEAASANARRTTPAKRARRPRYQPVDHGRPSDAFDLWKCAVAQPGFKHVNGRAQAALQYLILEWCDTEAKCWPSVATIAAALGCDAKSARNALNQLEQQGLIEFPEGRNGGRVHNGAGRSNLVVVKAALVNSGENARLATWAKAPALTWEESPGLTWAKTPAERNTGEQNAKERDTPSTPPAGAGGSEGGREREHLIEGMIGAYLKAVGRDSFKTSSERTRAVDAFGEIADGGCDVDDLRDAMSEWEARGWDWQMTPKALAKNLGSLSDGVRRSSLGLHGARGRGLSAAEIAALDLTDIDDRVVSEAAAPADVLYVEGQVAEDDERGTGATEAEPLNFDLDEAFVQAFGYTIEESERRARRAA